MSDEKRGRSPLEIILLVVSILAAIKFLSEMFGSKKGSAAAGEQLGQDARDKQYKALAPTIDDAKLMDYANILDNALLRSTTEDEDAVYGVYEKMRNISDVYRLNEIFGDRRLMYTLRYVTIPQAINELFNPTEKKKLNEILHKKGIDYSFE